jgi:hypothetical protein
MADSSEVHGENATVGEVAWKIGIMYHIRVEGLAHTI